MLILKKDLKILHLLILKIHTSFSLKLKIKDIVFLFVFNRTTFPRLILHGQKTFWIGGSASFIAYVVVVWACLHLPISVVYTLRETSVFFAVLLANLFLKEKLTLSKVLLIGMLCLGVLLIKSSL